MSIQISQDGDHSPATPRTVLRGVKHQLAHLGLDSLYLVVEYPHKDIFDRWASNVGDLYDQRLYQGIPCDGMVLKRGGNGYKLSVWDGDARLYLTDRVEDVLKNSPQAGQGMGLMLQLGPKWLVPFGEAFSANRLRQHVFGQLMLFGLPNPENYPIRINRLDVALDVLGLAVAGFSIDEWREQWVGYAKPKNFHFAPRSGELTGLSVGSYEGSVRFKVYDKFGESLLRGTSGFWRSVWGMDESEDKAVARFEWSVRCYAAKFSGMRYLSDYTYPGFLGLLNYLTVNWGRLCLPGEDLNHKSRWELAPLWAELCSFIDDWGFNSQEVARRDYDFKPDIKLSYLRSLAGWLAGFQARVGIEGESEGPASLAQALAYLYSMGLSFEDVQRNAEDKFDLFSKLVGGGLHEQENNL